ncbi:MAG: pilus assembly protein PilM [bacterium]|nr:pilus assembly protein PilM [bacterium]
MAKVVSIEVGYSLTRICEIDYKVKNPKVYASFTIPTPVDTYEDGLISQPEALAEAVKAGLAEHGIKTKQTVYSINSTKIANREVMLPFVKENRIESLLEVNATDYFPVDISNYKLTYSILDTVTAEDGTKQYKLLVLAAPKDLLESYYAVSSQAGLSISALDYAGNSIVAMTKQAFQDDTHMIVKVDERSTLLTIYSAGNMVLQRTVPYGADTAAETIMEAEEGQEVSYGVAVDLLRKKPCIRKSLDPSEEDPNDEDDEEVKKFRMEITESLGMLSNGILRVIDYYNSRNSESQIQDVWLTGYAENFVGLTEFLSGEVGTQVQPLSDAPGINNGADSRNKGEFVSCIGSVLEPLDLIPDEHNDKKKKKAKPGKDGETTASGTTDYIRVAVLALVGCIVVAGALAAVSCLTYKDVADQNKALIAKEAELAPVEQIYQEYNDTSALFNDVKVMYAETTTQNENLLAFLYELQDKLPSTVNVLSFSADATTVSMNINVESKEAAALTVVEIRDFDSIEDANINALTETADETGNVVVNFSISCTYAVLSDASDGTETDGATDTTVVQ